MGLYDDILGEEPIAVEPQNNELKAGNLFDDILANPQDAAQSTDGFQPNFAEGQTNPIFDSAKNMLQGGIKYSQNFVNNFGQGLNAPVQNPNVAQGLGNVARDLKGFGAGLIHGIPQFIGDLKNQTAVTGSNIAQNPSNLGSVLPAVGHGIDKAMSDIAGGIANLPEAFAASYMGREYNPKIQTVAPVEGTADLITDIMFDKGLISEQQYKNYIAHKLKARQDQAKVPLAETIGEFLPAMLPVGKAAGLGKTAQTASNLSKAEKIAKTAQEIAKGSAVGAGYGFVANPQGSLAERSQAAGSGAAAGAALGAGGKALQAGGKAAAPYAFKAAKNTAYAAGKGARTVLDVSAEIKDRLNPNNYETVLDARPVETGTGLSKRTVYETKQKRVFKRPNNTKDVNTGSEAPKIGTQKVGTDFVMGESGELKTPARPNRVQKLLTESGETAKNNAGAFDNSVRNEKQEKAKKEVIDRIKKLAPKTVEKETAKIEQSSSNFKKGDIVKSSEGEVFEVGENGEFRNVDSDEIIAPSADESFSTYKANEKELIQKQEFKYDAKAKGDTNAHNYAMAQDEVVEAYNNYVKNPTVENREIYQDTYGAKTSEFMQKEDSFKKDNPIAKIAPKTVEKIQENNGTGQASETSSNSPVNNKIRETVSGENLVKGESYAVNSINDVLKFTGEYRDNKNPVFTGLTGKTWVLYPDNEFRKAGVLDTVSTNINAKTVNKNHTDQVGDMVSPAAKKTKTTKTTKKPTLRYTQRDKYLVATDSAGEIYHTDGNAMFKYSFVNHQNTKSTKPKNGDFNASEIMGKAENNSIKLEDIGKANEFMINRHKVKGRIFQYKTPDGEARYTAINDKYLLDKKGIELYADEKNMYNPYKVMKNGEYIGVVMPIMLGNKDLEAKFVDVPKMEQSTNIKESEGKNEPTTTDERRQNVSKTNEKAETGVRGTEKEQSRVGEVLRGNGQEELQQPSVSNGRGISPKDKEIIEKEYKNQHELNKAIEDYINNEEYKKYAGSVRMPQEVKDWLKKYAGAGGLEKQGAEGKGLLSEYYTPKNIVDKMWDLTAQYIDTKNAKVLEPSAGIGRFLENSNQGENFDIVEMNPVSARIAKILYPNANVTTGEFQEKFIDKSNNRAVKNVTPEYDIVIGNPPYGDYNGVYKSIEGKNYKRLEAYFINRGLDTLKDNGIMTFIVPSSFLSGKSGKLEIANKCTLLDAYRLPNNTFDTTSIGTDIIVLRKKTRGATESNLFSDKWFEKHPEKILGEVEKGKGQWGSDIVKGDKNAVDSIDTSKKDIKETSTEKTIKKLAPKTAAKKATQKAKTTPKTEAKGNVEYETYKPDVQIDSADYETFKDTQIDGTLPKDKYKPSEKINQFNGELYNDFNYLQGDIYEKLDKLKTEDISEAQKEIQRKKLESVLPTPKKAEDIRFNPTSDFIQEFDLDKAEAPRWETKRSPLVQGFLDYLGEIPRNGGEDDYSSYNMRAYLSGERVRFNINFPAKSPEYVREYSKRLSKLKNTVEKHFSNYVAKSLDKDVKDRLVEDWNRRFNGIYNPDYTKMPLLVKDLNAKFKGSDLKLKETQIEGINFLANKGVGLIGFEVGVGKTLTGIISTVQNMQMGRCKKPLIVIPKNVKKNWKEEFAETFPNVKVVDVDNLSKWNGKVEEGTVTLATYQALDNIWYDKTNDELTDMIYAVGNDFGKEITKRGMEATKERYAKMVGKALEGNKKKYTLEDLGFDHVTFDEAHAGKNLFMDAKADSQEKTAGGAAKGTNSYFNMRGGRQSKVALRMFLLTQHILKENNSRNVFMLTATPFNNQSLEVFNMLSYLAKDKLEKMGLYNVYQFNENFIDVTSDIVLDANNNPVEKQVELGFKNVGALREIINSVMLIRTADEAGVVRPSKTVTRQKLDPTDEQLALFDQADELAMSKDIEGAMFKSLSLRRTASISPDIANNNYNVSPEEFIKNSPKLDYIMRCVEAMKNKDAKTSQLMYMPIGVKYLDKIKQYLVNKGVYKDNEIAIISADSALSNPEKEEARISKITDSFNDREGDIKLVIGTQKIQVGMNLNKNTSTLYMPYVEWNPTDYVQTVGRMWRQGNSYKNVRVVVPLLKNSSDSFMFQKLDEKIKRLNDLMGSDKEYIENADLETEEEKIAMISNPVKRAKMYTLLKKDNINFEIKKLEARENAVRDYKEKLKRYEDNIKYFQKKIDELMQTKKEKGELPVWQEERLKDQKKSLAANKKALENVKAQIEYNGYDFEGKDSAESVEAQKNKFEEELTKLEELERQKIEEYSVDYENERRNPKSIDELIKDFSDETEKLYSDDKANDIDIPDFMQKENEKSGIEDFDLSPVYEKVQKGAKVNELVKHLPKEVGEMLSDIAGDYKIVEMKTTNNRNKGSHSGKAKVIELNLKAIGNNPYKFVRTLAHEVEHARQTKVCQSILSKPRHTWTGEERTIIAHYNICQRANRDNQRFYKAHKNIIDEFYKQEFTSEKEMIQAVSNVEPKKRAIINRHIAIYETYRNAQFEVQARIQGEKYAERYTTRSSYGQGIPSSLSANSRGFKKWSLGTNSQNRSSQREYSIEPEYEENNEIREKGLDKVYKWHGDIGKDRFDVDKKLNSFIQTTKGTAKEFSRKLGIKVSDKMVREIMPFLRERTNLPEKLNRPDLKKFFDKLSGADKARLTDLADSVSSYFDKYYKNYEATNGVADAEGIENHISHIWDLDKKQKSLMTNYFTTSSKFAKTRTIDTLVRGIDGFEINGEMIYFKPKTLDYAEILKTSSDNLIKATHDRILAEELKNLKYDGKPLIMARSKAPSDWVEVTHPALNKAVYAGTTKNDDLILRKESVKVHPAIAPQVSAIFEVQKSDNKFWKAYDTVNGMLKQTTLGFSGFHGYALTESAVGNMGLKNTISELNPKKIYDSIKNGNYEVFKNEKIVKQAMEDGLQIGTPQSDMNRNQVEEFLGKIPHLGRLLRGAAEINNKILWDHLHTMYKIRSYEHILNKMGGVENTTKAQRREIAQWVNDSLGGQAWELLGFKKSSIKAAGRGLLSPDWNISAARQFFGLFDGKYLKDIFSGKDTEFWKFTKRVAEGLGVKGSDSASGTRGRIGRPTFLRAAIYSLILCNLINAYFREKDRKENPDLYPKVMRPIDYTIWANSTPTDSLSNKALPYAFLGRNKDNSARYLRLMKQFREVPEMVSSPIDKFGGKSASILNAISQTALGISPADIAKMLTGKSEDVYYNQEIWQGYGKYAQRKEGMDLVTGMGKTAAKSAMPFVISKSLDEKHDASAWDMFAQTSRGLTYGKTMRAYNKAYRENKKEDVFQKIGNRAYQDGMTTEEIDNAKKDALTKYRTDNSLRFKHSYVEAMENNDRAKIQQITDKMRKRHLPVDEQKRIYEVAYKEYMKKK